MSQVPYTEKAFLQLTGRRLLKYQREAKSRGEEYHDLSGFSRLQCGAQAKFRFEEVPGGYRAVALLKEHPNFPPNQLKEIASEILDGPVKLRAMKDDVLEYVREVDAGTSASG